MSHMTRDNLGPLCHFLLYNIRADSGGKFSACYGGRPLGRFLNLHFEVTFTFKLIAGF